MKILRRLGVALPGLTRKTLTESVAERPRTRRRPSAYRRQLEEKQKVRLNYGITEQQMVRCLETARRMPGAVGTNLLALLERRLDNVVFRLGLAPTVRAARQLVAHGHVQVDGRIVDRASYRVRVGEVIAFSAKARQSEGLRASAEVGPQLRLPGYLAVDPGECCGGRVIDLPSRADVPFPVREALVIEYYSR